MKAGLALSVALLTWLFWPEGQAAIGVWRTSTAYGHCWLILPIAGWLVWERRACFSVFPATPVLWPILLAVPLTGLWLVAYLLGIMEGRQLAVIGFLLVLLLGALGPRLWWALSPGLLYMIFLVPFGACLTPVLQHFTAGFVRIGLDALCIPNDVNALRIDIPEGSFYVAEACAGLRFLIASVAFGVLFAVTMFRSPLRRALFIVAACIIPVFANGFRGLGIVVLGHVLGSAQAANADHILYGWVFFTIVLVLLALTGLPFREDGGGVEVRPHSVSTPSRPAWAVCLPIMLLAAIGPGFGWAADALAVPSPPVVSPWVAGAGCMVGQSDIFICGTATIHATVAVLPRRANPARVVAVARAQAASGLADPDASVLDAPPGQWNLLVDQETGAAGAYLLWIDGAPSLGGMRDRVRLARDLLRGADTASVAVAVNSAGGAAALQRFLSGQGDLAGRLQAASQHR
jgi:exosortase A